MNDDYDNLDIRFKPDVWTGEAVQVTHVVECSLPEAVPPVSFVAHGVDEHGNPFDQPFTPGPENQGVRLRCSKVPSGSTVQILVATMNVTSMLTGVPIIKPTTKKRCAYVYAKGRYSLIQRPHHIDHSYPTQP